MSVNKEIKKITTETLRNLKGKGKIAMLTAYDYTMAQLADAGGLDAILVGDSAANVMAGHETTLPITLEQMIYHAQCVVRGASRALVVVDMPFGTYQSNPNKALDSAVKIMKETNAQAVKLEGGEEIAESVQKIINAGIPVMAHLGLTPQSINQLGSYALRAKKNAEAEKLKKDALLLQDLGAFALVLEKIPAQLAQEVTESLHIPTIGIGAGVHCDGQVLVLQDMLGMNEGFKPKFLRQYANLGEQITGAISQYVQDVKSENFPNESESY
ncbi:3-methyl-2-oxobutanoate hydroxymethyltransferase [Ornithobacterium rhinotracheale]|uniref:3-methyl-2-oxobutanoate hydroxymethyltransferase n=1 Tax=Ornithobacterium rhinotracheale (strain ATCC 51463 / DSM 15997 / CCUG 23171 / CIP 104009 / LMG 9086) TaxID=867902 RepID=I4A0H9_ORNRL|nr:3-methyl-2-oxobutanoate hydroxymethyltransferase [Ornithobacterium rhinotracheale]AFL97463.1 3-methyl-2-oxobutanoate hydroxymethyltransferase [Ornithobacterium rhinotracheale DSM 15997]AIP98993.1 3-methyl-2-oxobutanoate hydroxymethyltransferase [Ornithobacterium rhinotracheale ORT-UMN 88]KGB66924.1 3-methyl-2-oxobutanoate hydroxymethyltransferase [Ornithobacterium rhinotracheale H06-030791]MBN3661970.1 3-methyl-2-oxobutanoate hydroxymethyltransferase [Ornithobacterium rhinotracheale]MCK0195